jgi:hypothetical protein
MATRLAVLYFAVSTVLLIAPAYTVLGNHVHPRVFGLPWSLVYVLLVVGANLAVLGWLYHRRLIDHAEDEDDG